MHRAGYRYRLHVSGLPGSPDIVMPRFRTILFVNGCFWHRHPGCRRTSTPQTNVKYWESKFNRNVARDEENHRALRQDGWKVLVIWECQTTNLTKLNELLSEMLPARMPPG